MRALLARHATGLLVGTLAGTLALEAAVLASIAFGLPFAAFAIGQAAVDVTPGQVSTVLIDLLQFWAKRLAQIGAVAVHLVAAAVAGALAARGMPVLRAGAVAAIPWALDAVIAVAFAARNFDPVRTTADAAAAVGAYLVALGAMRGALAPSATDLRRRGYLLAGGLVAATLGAGDLVVAFLVSGGRRVAQQVAQRFDLFARPPVAAALPLAPEDPAFDATPGLTSQITPNSDFYVVDTALFKPVIDPTTWRLRVDGLVEAPYELTYEELLAMDAYEQVQTLICISNPIGGDLVSTAKWRGVRVADLLRRARPRSGALDLVMTSHDGYTDSIPVAKALEPTTLVAYAMNDEPLPVDHGFPARVLIPDIYGMKNVKWLVDLKVVPDDFFGYWEERGWSDVAVIHTMSRIDVPVRHVIRWSGGPLRLGGLAFAGARDVARVEVSLDAGKTWREARLGRQVNDFTWRRWLFEWTPDGPGAATLAVRAIDGKGEVQDPRRREPFPTGATGYHLVPLRIERA